MAATAFQRPRLWHEPELLTPAFMLFDIEVTLLDDAPPVLGLKLDFRPAAHCHTLCQQVDDAATTDRVKRIADEQRLGATINQIAALRTLSSAFESQVYLLSPGSIGLRRGRSCSG